MLPLILLASLTAHAAPIAGHAWDPSQTITIEIPQTPPEGLTTEEFQAELDAVLAAYNELTCTNELTLDWIEVEDPTETWPDNDGRAVLTHGDPDGSLLAGTVAAWVNRTGPLTHLDNAPVESVNGGTIALNGPISWTTSTKVEAGECAYQMNVGDALMWGVGSFLGLGPQYDVEEAAMFWLAEACKPIPPLNPDEIDTLRRLYGFRYDVHCTPAAATPPFDVSCEIRPLAGAAPATGIEWTLPDGATSGASQVDLEVTELGEVAVDVCFSSADCEEPMERCDHIVLAGCGPLEAKGEWSAPNEPRPFGAGYELLVEFRNTTEGSALCIDSGWWEVTRASDGEVLYASPDTDWNSWYLLMGELYLAELSLEGVNGPSTTVVEIDLRDDTDTPRSEPKAADEERGCGCATGGAPSALTGLFFLLPLVRRHR